MAGFFAALCGAQVMILSFRSARPEWRGAWIQELRMRSLSWVGEPGSADHMISCCSVSLAHWKASQSMVRGFFLGRITPRPTAAGGRTLQPAAPRIAPLHGDMATCGGKILIEDASQWLSQRRCSAEWTSQHSAISRLHGTFVRQGVPRVPTTVSRSGVPHLASTGGFYEYSNVPGGKFDFGQVGQFPVEDVVQGRR